MLTTWIISLLYLLIDYFFKRKSRIALWGLMNALAALLFILISTIYVGKFIIYYWYPYFFILTAGLIIIIILRLLQFFFFPFLFWRKKDLGPQTFIEWSQIFKGKKLSLLKMYKYSEKESCPNYPHYNYIQWSRKRFYKLNKDVLSDPNWVFEEPSPSYNRVFVYASGYVYVICTKCKTQLQKLECKIGTMEPLKIYNLYRKFRDIIY
jgi:MFS family permease